MDEASGSDTDYLMVGRSQEAGAHGHDLVTDPEDGLLYCRRCPLVAYDLDDAATEPVCPMPLRP